MDKATRQRLLGGLVLIVGAAIFLPIVLDGSGAKLTVPPMPAPPVVEGVEAISPKLGESIREAEQAVAEAHQPVSDIEEDVQPDASATVVEELPVAAPVVADSTKAADKAAEQAAKEKLAREKAEAEAKKLAAEKAAKEKLVAEKAAKEAAAKAEQEKAKQLAAKAAAATTAVAASATTKAATDLPTAWVVQVARLSTKAKADELVAKLRKKNFQAKALEESGSWRVVVGPELKKELAESVKARLVSDPELGVSGAFLQAYKL